MVKNSPKRNRRRTFPEYLKTHWFDWLVFTYLAALLSLGWINFNSTPSVTLQSYSYVGQSALTGQFIKGTLTETVNPKTNKSTLTTTIRLNGELSTCSGNWISPGIASLNCNNSLTFIIQTTE